MNRESLDNLAQALDTNMNENPTSLKSAGLSYPTPALPFKFERGEKIRHLNSGGDYVIVELPDHNVLEATWEPAYGYVKLGDAFDSPFIHRSQKEMEDGRFVSVQKPDKNEMLALQTDDAIGQLMRYGDSLERPELVAVLDRLSVINDHLAHGRVLALIEKEVEEIKALLAKVQSQ